MQEAEQLRQCPDRYRRRAIVLTPVFHSELEKTGWIRRQSRSDRCPRPTESKANRSLTLQLQRKAIAAKEAKLTGLADAGFLTIGEHDDSDFLMAAGLRPMPPARLRNPFLAIRPMDAPP